MKLSGNAIVDGFSNEIKRQLEEQIDEELGKVRQRLQDKSKEIIAGISIRLMENITLERMGTDLVIRIQNFEKRNHE